MSTWARPHCYAASSPLPPWPPQPSSSPSTWRRSTYTVKAGGAGGRPGAGQVTVHLAPAASDIRTAGAAWTCTQSLAGADDDYQPAAHTDVACSNASMMAATPPLTVTIKAPGSPGMIRACAVAAKRGPTCVSTTVD